MPKVDNRSHSTTARPGTWTHSTSTAATTSRGSRCRPLVALVALLAIVPRLILTVEVPGARLILDARPLARAFDLAPARGTRLPGAGVHRTHASGRYLSAAVGIASCALKGAATCCLGCFQYSRRPGLICRS